MAATQIIGREEELASVEAFLERTQSGPAALVLSGEAGIGKTILWQAGVDEAREHFDRVLTCRGVEAEASFAFAGLSELLAGVIGEVAPGLAPPRRHALEVALQLVEPGETAPDAHVIGLALLDVLQTLAERGPLLVALDDVQWLDTTSASVLNIAVHRLRDQRVGLLATVRLSPEAASPLELDRSLSEDRITQLDLRPLSLGALYELLKQRVGLDLTRPELARVQEATAGNPFFALELGRELVRTNTRPTVGQTLPMPESLRELLGGRLARLPTHTGDVLLQAAALARPTVELVAAAYGDREPALEALEAAVREGVIELDGLYVRFAHPLLASICYEQAPVWKRQAVHRALAEVVTDAEERARHLALAADRPDERVALELDGAAEQAAARGATAAAAELYELAAGLTPADPALAQQRLFRAASLHRLAGERERAVAMLEELLPEVPHGVQRADVLFELAQTRRVDYPTMIELCGEALAEAAGDDARAARILAYRSWAHLTANDVDAAFPDARAALERAERVGDPTLLAAAIARVAHAETWAAAEITPGLLERGVEIEERLGLSLEYMESPRFALARLLIRQGELDQARAIAKELEANAVTRGDEASRVDLLWRLGWLEWYAGDWGPALEYCAAAIELTEQGQDIRTFVGRIKALIETDLGLVEEARASAEEGLALAKAQVIETNIVACLSVLGRLELSLGNLEAAADYLRGLPGRLLANGLKDPTLPVWADAIETLIGLGELKEARGYLKPYEGNSSRLRSPWAMAAASRCRGLLAAAEGDPEAALAAFERALAALEGRPFPLERGRTLLCAGMVRRQAQQKKAARECLNEALQIFEELGARLWAEKARAELRRISGRRAPSDELTETERRVAELAAQGRTNKEIAAELFMGVSTVEAHLSHVYRKLGVRRAELAGRLDRVEA